MVKTPHWAVLFTHFVMLVIVETVECPADISDAIGGWSTSGVGHACGNTDLNVKLNG